MGSYKAILSGSTVGKSGRLYQYDAGHTLAVPFSELRHCKSMIWIGDEPDEVEYPKHIGGPYYLLSNGEKVKGKSKALKEQSKL